MKPLKIIMIATLIVFPILLFAQETDTIESYYDYEIIQTSYLNGNDSVYHVFFVIDTSEIKKFKSIAVFTEEKEKVFSVKPEDISGDSMFDLQLNHYRIDMGNWSGSLNWIVKGKKHDESEEQLKDKKQKTKHIQLHKEKPKPLKRVKSTPITEEQEN